MAEYQGHRSWNSWNVSLWIANEEYLYRQALECLRVYKTIPRAARRMLELLPDKTPDGANYNLTCVKEALSDLRD